MGTGLASRPPGRGTLASVKGIPGRLRKWMRWGLVGLVLGAGGAGAREGLVPWRSPAELDGPQVWMRQSVWAGPWGRGVEDAVDFVVPYPLPEAVLYVAAPEARLLAEPSPAARRIGSFTPYAPVSVVHSKPWLPAGFVAVFDKGRVSGFLPRETLVARPPPVERLWAECHAALERENDERARQLGQVARELYPEDARTLALATVLGLDEGEWMPPELSSPGSELPAPGTHVTPGATLHVGAPSLPLLKRRVVAGLAPESWLPINTPVLVLDVGGGWARVREAFPGEPRARVGREGSTRWRSRFHEPVEDDVPVGREGYVVARYLEASPVDPRALRALARSPRRKGSREEVLGLLVQASAAEPWNRDTQREAFEWALGLKRAGSRSHPARVLPVRAEAVQVLLEGLAEEAFGGPAKAPETPQLETALYYGCGGDVLAAEVFEEQDAVVQDALGNGASVLPVDVCVRAVDAAPPPPPPPPRHVACPELAKFSEDEDPPARRAALDREEAAARRQYEEVLRPEFERRLKRLREHFPQGPYFCVSVSNPAPRPRVNLRVQYYALPAVEEACGSPSKRPQRATDSLRVGEVVVPYLASGAKAELCIEVPRYEGMLYGAVLAPDVKAAEVFVRRLAWVRELMEESPEEMTYVEYLDALSSLLPHEVLSTAVERECPETCY